MKNYLLWGWLFFTATAGFCRMDNEGKSSPAVSISSSPAVVSGGSTDISKINDGSRLTIRRDDTIERPEALLNALWKPGFFDDTRLSVGLQTLMVGQNTDTAPAVALRVRPHPSPSPFKGEGRGEGWSYEVGGMIPHLVTGSFQKIQQTIGNVSYEARVKKLWEMHVAADYDFRRGFCGLPSSIVPAAGFGVSMLHLSNDINTVTTVSYQILSQTFSYKDYLTYQDNRYAFSPLFRVGVALFPDRLISARVDAAYVGYANTVTAAGQTFDLGFSGWMLRTVLQLKL